MTEWDKPAAVDALRENLFRMIGLSGLGDLEVIASCERWQKPPQ